jgi:uncharacterized membrane protein
MRRLIGLLSVLFFSGLPASAQMGTGQGGNMGSGQGGGMMDGGWGWGMNSGGLILVVIVVLVILGVVSPGQTEVAGKPPDGNSCAAATCFSVNVSNQEKSCSDEQGKAHAEAQYLPATEERQ